jgi:hypothetical protein
MTSKLSRSLLISASQNAENFFSRVVISPAQNAKTWFSNQLRVDFCPLISEKTRL